MKIFNRRLIVILVATQLLPGYVDTAECDGVESVSGQKITLELVSNQFQGVLDITAPSADTERLFAVEKCGRVRIVRLLDDAILAEPFLDIRSKVECGGDLGLIGLAFHPQYQSNGYFFVHYTRAGTGVVNCRGANAAESVISRFSVSSSDPDRADPGSEVVLLTFDQPYSNHNGGRVAFSPLDGYLYIGSGDGGDADDPCNQAQDPLSYHGKMLRVDVSGEEPYRIPDDNPFVGQEDVLPEIWALGLREPWKFAFDSQNGDLYIGDVGQGLWEEIDYQPGTSVGGQNYEWKVREGDHDLHTSVSFTIGNRTPPVFEYGHGSGVFRGCSVTGGVVYRGCRMPDLHGRYFFADFCNNWVGSFRVENGAVVDLKDHTEELNAGIAPSSFANIVAFGTDAHGEVYVCQFDTTLYRIVPVNNPPTAAIIPNPDPPVVRLVAGSAMVTLDATASDDGEGGNQGLTYAWEKVNGPDGFDMSLPNGASTAITFTDPGEYTFRLTVNDGIDSDFAEQIVTVLADFRRGDCNDDGTLDISDAVCALDWLFTGETSPNCIAVLNANGDEAIDIGDAVWVLNFLFAGGPSLVEPFPDCGPGLLRADQELGCKTPPKTCR